MTLDHTYRQELVNKGFYTLEEAEKAVASNLITRAIGADSQVKPDVQTISVLVGDVILACSDGLNDMIGDHEIGALIERYTSETEGLVDEAVLNSLCESLINAANKAGGKDNVTVGLLQVTHPSGEVQAADPRTEIDAQSTNEVPPGCVAAGMTHPGMKRSHNEDQVAFDPARGILIVADGVGGHNAGEVASAITTESIMRALCPDDVYADPAYRAQGSAAPVVLDKIEAVFWDEVKDKDSDPSALAVLQSPTCLADDELDDLAALGSADPDQSPDYRNDTATEDDAFLKAVQTFKVGMWVEFCAAETSGSRARLSWMNQQRSRFLFTDRRGNKVAESTAHGLALELRMLRLRVLETVPLFDRTISSLTARLRRSAYQSAESVEALAAE